MSIVSLHDAHLVVAGHCLLDNTNLQIHAKDRIALVGRNGAGKSTLLKLLQGEITLDGGHMQHNASLRIASLTQEVPTHAHETVYHFLVKGLGSLGEVLAAYHQAVQSNDAPAQAKCQQLMDNLHAWDILPKVETMATRLGVDIHKDMANLSGGMKRRVLLAAALIANPELLLLDEPTNHLDMQAIEWLESYLSHFTGSLVLVTHDREFLKQVTNRIVQIDRGKLIAHDCDYETYLDRREAMLLSEDRSNALFDKKLAGEEVWIRTGIQARRTRNEGRVRALKALREQHKARHNQLGKVQSMALAVNRSGALIVNAEHVDYRLGDRILLKDFSLLLTRGDKLGIIGPNGCGKTTLVRLLLGEIKPSAGQIKRGTALQVAYFDQLRTVLVEDNTVLFNVADGADFVTVHGKQKHVASYLRDFLFPAEKLNQQVSTLSGGERNRLLLAKLFAKPVNLLVMDEPTNDLDIETLELLENILIEYQGTLVLISHDRAFINQVVTSVLVYEEPGVFTEWVGGYDEYKCNKQKRKETAPTLSVTTKPTRAYNKLSFNEQRELAQLPGHIEALENKIQEQQHAMGASEFYQQEAPIIAQVSKQIEEAQALLAKLYARWEDLAARE